MKSAFFYLILIFSITGCYQNNSKDLIDESEFKDPSMEYRSIPFYSLNDELDAKELTKQLAAFKEGGFGGSYLHSRIGLLTGYLGEEWWEAMDAGVKASDSLGIQAWFYDEDKWPSGFAGGIIPRMDEAYRGHALIRMLLDDETPPTGTVLHKDDKYKYVDCRYEMGDAWFNGTCWVDLMNPDMVKAFIDVSYKPYAERYKARYGTSTFGIFTDEPQISPRFADRYGKHGLVGFSPTLIDRFKNENGYDLAPNLAELFDTVGDYPRIRIDYYRTLANQFEESFSKQIGDYCRENNMIWTGHYNGEESTFANVRNVGNMAIQYRHMQQPGLDHLSLRIRGDLYGAKQVSSVANQYGIKRRLSEAFGVSGQNMSFEDRKWITDWHGLMGINHICPHLSLYSMKGERKRDYPPTLSPQQPWWRYNKTMEDYIGRICYVNTLGQQQADLLVLSPLESTFIELDVNNTNDNRRREAAFYSLLRNLMDQHVDYDIGDEQILSDMASVKNETLVVGKMKYKALVLPYMLTIRQSTLTLLEEMQKMGLNIYYTGEYPKYIDGTIDSNKIEDILGKAIKLKPEDVLTNLGNDLDQALTISGENTRLLWKNRRANAESIVYQLSNISRLETVECSIVTQGEQVTLWNPATGESNLLDHETELIFAPAQTWIISMGDGSTVTINSESHEKEDELPAEMILPNEWEGKRIDVNALTLDFAQYSKGLQDAYSDQEPVIGIHNRLTDTHYNGLLKLKYNFRVQDIPQNCALVLEQPEMYKSILLNDQEIKFTDNKSYRDHTFRMQTLNQVLRAGSNSVVLILNYVAPILDSFDPYERYGTEIESIYLTGDFGVSFIEDNLEEDFVTEKNRQGVFRQQDIYLVNDFSITTEGKIFKGTLVKEGYPFYTGDFELTQSFNIEKKDDTKKYSLIFDEIEATVLSLSINGTAMDPIAWNPWKVDITDVINQGENKISVTLTNSLRNLLGPHHHIGGELIGVGPGSFTGISFWTSPLEGQQDWYDRRLSGTASLWVDDYFLIPFGVKDVKLSIE